MIPPNPLDPFFAVRLAEMLGHFLWQGAAVAAAIFAAWPALARTSAAVRYRIFLSAMLVMAACPVVTFCLLRPAAETESPTRESIRSALIDRDALVPAATTPATVAPGTARSGPLARMSGGSDLPAEAPRFAVAHGGLERKLRPYAGRIVALYWIGVALMLARFLIGLRTAQRLRMTSRPAGKPLLREALVRQARLLGLRAAPALAWSRKVAVPVLVGIMRPLILLPLSFATELSPHQIESVLAHELAHLRRHDHLALLFQRLVESLLFFHPAVWLMSSLLNAERENCCDDLVVATGARPLDYAESLVRMAAAALGAGAPSPLGLAATGRSSHLRRRIHRLLAPGRGDRFILSPPTAGAVVLAVIAAAVITRAIADVGSRPLGMMSADAMQPRPKPLPIEQLLSRATALRARIKKLSVTTEQTFTFPGNRETLFGWDDIVVNGNEAFNHHRWGSKPGDTRGDTEVAYDGRRTMAYDAARNYLEIADGRVTDGFQADLSPTGFFRLNPLWAPQSAPASWQDASFLSVLLRDPHAVVRPDLEPIENHLCEVVEIPGWTTLWLDVNRGLLALRQEDYASPGTFVYTVQEAMELEPGIWVAVRGAYELVPRQKDPHAPVGNPMSQIAVEKGPDGRLLIAINSQPGGEIFNLERHVNHATEVVRPMGGRGYAIQPWGNANDGVRCRLWQEEDGRIGDDFCVDVSNAGAHHIVVEPAVEIEVDGQWYKLAAPSTVNAAQFKVPEGRCARRAVGPIALTANWVSIENGEPLRLGRGPHKLRARLVAHLDRENGPPLSLVSGPAEF